jgi:hypothetical protein
MPTPPYNSSINGRAVKEIFMLENSNLLDGATAKRVNELVINYQDISAKLKDLETSKKLILEELFTLTEIGVNETGKFVFNIVENKGRVSIGAKKLQEQAPEIFGEISNLGLVSVGENYLTVRGIKLKGDRV